MFWNQIMVMAAQRHYECNVCHWIVHFKGLILHDGNFTLIKQGGLQEQYPQGEKPKGAPKGPQSPWALTMRAEGKRLGSLSWFLSLVCFCHPSIDVLKYNSANSTLFLNFLLPSHLLIVLHYFLAYFGLPSFKKFLRL